MDGGRITCPRCGANNFESASACWKCGAALAPAAPSDGRRSAPVAPAYAPAASVVQGDPKASQRAAIWMGLTLPYFGFPIGWAFLMMEDYRRQSIGRVCIFWSTIGLIAHLLLMLVLSAAATPLLVKMLLPVMNQMQSGGTGDPLRPLPRRLDGGQ